MSLRCLITAGPTREFFDPVRFISNPSSGKMGFALAEAALEAGWNVDLVSGPVALTEPEGAIRYPVVTGEEMFHQVDALFDACDVLLMTAAVCDLRPKAPSQRKVKKDELEMMAEFEPVFDILATIAARKQPAQCVVGFAAETNNLETHARDKLVRKNLDFIAANQVGGPQSAFEADDNTIHLIGRDGQTQRLGPANKREVAAQMIAILKRRFDA
ncbi:MAG: phosphopantothenoylcysteine decarboxylase [Opitutales bacterium]